MRLWLERAPGDVCAVQAMLNLFAMPDIDRHLPLAVGGGIAVIAREVPQLALPFLAQTLGISVVLAGMSMREHLRENVRALTLPPLTEERLTELRAAAVA